MDLESRLEIVLAVRERQRAGVPGGRRSASVSSSNDLDILEGTHMKPRQKWTLAGVNRGVGSSISPLARSIERNPPGLRSSWAK